VQLHHAIEIPTPQVTPHSCNHSWDTRQVHMGPSYPIKQKENWRCPTQGCSLHNRQIQIYKQHDHNSWQIGMGEVANPKTIMCQPNYDVHVPCLPLFSSH
jgi:hypothetical protein